MWAFHCYCSVSKNTMNKNRIENLADGVFAIVMTLLVLDLKIPDATNHTELITDLLANTPVFIAYILVFITLTNYWFSHHGLISIFAKKVTNHLALLNIIFLFFLSLLPFSANLLGRYSIDPTATVIYGINILCIIVALILMRQEIFSHTENEIHDADDLSIDYGETRLLISIIGTLLGIACAFYDTRLAIVCYVIPVFLGLIPMSIRSTTTILRKWKLWLHIDHIL